MGYRKHRYNMQEETKADNAHLYKMRRFCMSEIADTRRTVVGAYATGLAAQRVTRAALDC